MHIIEIEERRFSTFDNNVQIINEIFDCSEVFMRRKARRQGTINAGKFLNYDRTFTIGLSKTWNKTISCGALSVV